MKKSLVIFLLLFGSTIGGALAQMGIPYGISTVQAAFAGALQLTQAVIQKPTAWVGNSSASNAIVWASDPSQGVSPGSNPLTGVCTDSVICTSYFWMIGRDQLDASASAYYEHYFLDNFGGAGAKGSHHTGLFWFKYVATPDDTGQPYTALNSWTDVSAPGNGSFWAGNDKTRFLSGATGHQLLEARELDCEANSGSSMQDKNCVQIVLSAGDAVLGSRSNIGLTLNNAVGSTSYDCVLCMGAPSGVIPYNSTSTVFGCWPNGATRNSSGQALPTGSCGTAFTIMDYSGASIAPGGMPFIMPQVTPATSGDACKTGGIEWDSNFIYVCTATNTIKRAALSTF